MKQYLLKKFDEVEALFNERVLIPSEYFSYRQSYTVGPEIITNMDFYEFDFEPYISLGASLGMSCFGIQGTENRLYLTHMNIGGHGPLCTVRAVSLEQLKDLNYLESMCKNYCANLESNAISIGQYKL